MTQIAGAFDAQRQAEMEAGRARLREIAARDPASRKADMSHIFKNSDAEIEEDEKRRHELLNAVGPADKAVADRAGAELVDQAQTELEAVQHGANRRETITQNFHEYQVEKLDHPTVDTGEAEQVTTDLVTAQAVHQPTPMAHEHRDFPTETVPLNTSSTPNERLSTHVQVPEDVHVPKTEKQARKIAKAKVPPVKRVVKEGALQPEHESVEEAVDIFEKAPEEIFSMPKPPKTVA